ncbi:MAG: glutamate racemase [Nitriliruptor sp.]|nr:MAG: glutamate racemase [Nitriliruptor sp.]
MRDAPIGVFDSGLGGLTVLQSLTDLLPGEDLIYVGDTARYPYGDRTTEQLQRCALAIATDLQAAGAKLIVIACNSATAAALDLVRERIPVPVIGVVAPGLRAAAATSRTGRALVIGTRMTVESGIYARTVADLQLDLEVATLACPGFVEMVEAGRTEGPSVVRTVRERLAPMLTSRVDTLVLGCTHFPLLARPISEVVGRGVTLVSSADETAFEVRDLLERTGWLRDRSTQGAIRVLTSGSPARFRTLGERFLGVPLTDVQAHAFPELDDLVSADR